MFSINDDEEKKAPTLLELSRSHKRNTAPPPEAESSDSDADEPPVARRESQARSSFIFSYSEGIGLSSINEKFVTKSANQKCFEKKNFASPTTRTSMTTTSQESEKRLQGRSSIQQDSVVKIKNSNEKTRTRQCQSHYFKSLRPGITASECTDINGKSKPVIGAGLQLTPYCICQRSRPKLTNWKAWTFSGLATVMCVVFPVISFTADVSFLAICRNKYSEASEILEETNKTHGTTLPTHVTSNKNEMIDPHDNRRHHLHRSKRDFEGLEMIAMKNNPSGRLSPNDGNSESFRLKHSVRHKKRHAAPSALNSLDEFVNLNNTIANTLKLTSPAPLTGIDFNEIIVTAQSGCRVVFSDDECLSQERLIAHMTSKNASDQLNAFNHIITDIFEPVFILGSFPSFLLCIFTRMVIALTPHNHFFSAYVMNMATMTLWLITGALSFHMASYYAGPTGFGCWKCVRNGTCSNTSESSILDYDLRTSLVAATVTKIVDGSASGTILTLVLCRIIWKKRGHVSCWWYLIRAILFLASFAFFVTLSATMMVMPSLVVFRFELLNKLPYFKGGDILCRFSEILAVVGATAWSVSFLVLIIYLGCKTFVYCRRREHFMDDV